MPYMTEYPMPDGVETKGAVLINPGGAFQYRAEKPEGSDVAEALTKLGYKCFVVHYRVIPYTMQDLIYHQHFLLMVQKIHFIIR